MQSITEPIDKITCLKFKLNTTINIQEKFSGKDVLQIARKTGLEPQAFFCKTLGVCNEEPQEPSTTVIIIHLDFDEHIHVISKLVAPFGQVVSEPEEIVIDEDGLEVLFGVSSGKYKQIYR